MKFEDYSINLNETDRDELISEWRWAVPYSLKLVSVTKFGDCFFQSEDDEIVFLDTLDGSLSNLGKGDLSAQEFFELSKEQLSKDWTDLCEERGMLLDAGQCYGWKIHPLMGGAFAFENIALFSLRVYLSITGHLVRQIATKPQGFRVSGFTEEGKEP